MANGATAVVKTKTLRLAPEFEAGLALLKSVLGMPVNKMVNEAVGEYIRKRSAEVEADLTGVLEQVKAYRRADPHFKQARARFVDAEARLAGNDPVEGVVVELESPAGNRRKPKAGPAQTMIRGLLKAHS
jgi:predicted DNA-binding protein